MGIKVKSYVTIAELVPLLLLLTGLYLVPLHLVQLDFSRIPGDLGDARFNNFILEHGYQYLLGNVRSYWTAPFMYPFKSVIAFSDNLVGTLPLYAFFRKVGADRETAFQLWITGMFALNFIFCYWALRKWSGSILWASAGAYIYSFSIFFLGQLHHVQVFPRFIIPFVFYWTWQFLKTYRLRYLAALILGTIYQFYCGVYLGFFLLYCLLFFFIAWLIIYRDLRFFKSLIIPRKALLIAGIIAGAVLLMLPLMKPYLDISGKFGTRRFDEAESSIPTLRSYFFTTPSPVFWDFLTWHARTVIKGWWEHFMFTGILPWLGVLFFPLAYFSKLTSAENKKQLLFLFTALFLSFIFCLNINGKTLYHVIYLIPGFSSMRSINRIINVEIFLFIILTIFVFRQLKMNYPVLKTIFLLLPLLVVADNLMYYWDTKYYKKEVGQNRVSHIKELISNQYDKKHEAIAFEWFGIEGKEVDVNLDVMLASQELGIPCVNAYTGMYPREYLPFFYRSDEKSLLDWCKYNNHDPADIQRINIAGIPERQRIYCSLLAYNNKFVSMDKSQGDLAIAKAKINSDWENLVLIELSNGKWIIQANDGRFTMCNLNNQGTLEATSTHTADWEMYDLTYDATGKIALKGINNKYISVDVSERLIAKAESISNSELFTIVKRPPPVVIYTR